MWYTHIVIATGYAYQACDPYCYIMTIKFHDNVEKCRRLIFTVIHIQVIVMTFVYLAVWLGLCVVLSMVMTVYVELKIGCDKYDERRVPGTCTTLYEPSKYIN